MSITGILTSNVNYKKDPAHSRC